jgi:PAS domain S-box-containing protein
MDMKPTHAEPGKQIKVLQKEAGMLRALADAPFEAIFLSEKGTCLDQNKTAERMFGYTVEEVHRLHVWDWDAQWSQAELMEMAREVDDSGDHFETVHRCKDGSTDDVEISTNGAVYQGQKLIFCVCRDITHRKQAENEREKLISELQTTLAEVKTLRGIIPICTNCKKIRDDAGYWQKVEAYIQKHSEALFSHSICPECVKKLYGDM